MWFLVSLLLATGNANILPVQVKHESDKITETKNENRVQILIFNIVQKQKTKKGNGNLKSVIQSCGKKEIEVVSSM